MSGLEGYSVRGGREEEGRRRSRLTPRLPADSGQMVLGEVGDLREAGRRGGLGMGAGSAPQKALFSACLARLVIHRQGFLVRCGWRFL